ncbi:hypothetical protein Vretimale_14274 [Volvox reticuliferus]|uniref:Kinesin motor domain-containing protein n=2 Tax=Volvox reticuliferus TaxID=1737510 RepID=A0A8J4LTV4_9CHLO|nr:hypothetical protein Vretifemale_15275 [Volvox reticuliferus]GIM10690.1 hypothetical protein Vretimale_14274 [Volvox reticuliferus]
MEQLGLGMQKPDFGARKASSPGDEVRTPSENDLMITRLVARIAELEERLYKKELEAPAIGNRAPLDSSDGTGAYGGASGHHHDNNLNQHQQEQLMRTPVGPMVPAAPRLRDSFLATLRESWAKLELHAGGGGGGAAATAAAMASSTAATTALPMRSLDMVASPTRVGMSANAAAPAGTAPPPAYAKIIGGAVETGGGGAAAASVSDDVGPPLDTIPSADDLQAGSFNFSTHLVVDYSKPTHGSPTTPARRIHKGEKSAGSGEDEEDSGSGDGDDGDSLSSVGSSGMGYDTSAEEQELGRRRSNMTGPKPSVGSALGMVHGPVSTPPRVGVGAGGGGGGDGSTRRPPLPPPIRQGPGSRSASDNGSGPTTGPLSCDHQQQPPLQPPQPAGGVPSRAAAWSGTVLSKLGLAFGRDRSGGAAATDPRDVSTSARNAATGSMQPPLPLFRQPTLGMGTELVSDVAFSDRALEEQLKAGGALGRMRSDTGDTAGRRYYRYVFDPADVQAEMEVTARVRRAAAEALMEANSKLAEAQAAQAALQQQVEQAKQLEQELEVLRAECSAAQAAKAAMEDEMATARRQLEAMKETEASLQAELEGVRSQADIWRSSKGGEPEKLKQENTLLRSQLTNRLSELQSCRSRLSDGEAERQRLLREAEELRNKIQWLTKINLQLETAASQLNDARRAASEWEERFMRERNVRRRLHDQLQLLRGNIRVICRVRPVTVGQRDMVSYPLEGLLAISPPDKKYQEFEFDHVFPPSASQAVVFEEAVVSLVRDVADGHNACVLAYGQAGSGKTYTLQGPPEDPGICLRALSELLRIATEESGGSGAGAAAVTGPSRCSSSTGELASADAIDATPVEGEGASAVAAGADATADTQATAAVAPATASATRIGRYSFWFSMSQLYNEEIYDLLAPGMGEQGAAAVKALEVLTLGPGELPPGADRVPGITWRPVVSVEGVEALLQEGGRNRAAIASALNAPNSRSHVLISLRVEAEVAEGAAGRGQPAVSILHFADLGGSERGEKNDTTGQQAREVQSINRSLSVLGDVISALQRRSSNIPFRNSKLTSVIQDALCGDSKVLLVCNIAPEATSSSETVSSLNFASRAAQLELGIARQSASVERFEPSPRSPGQGFQERMLPEGGSGGGGASRGAAATAFTSSGASSPQLHLLQPLPIMNGTAAKVRAAAAAAAAAMAAASTSGGGRTSQSFVGMNGIVTGSCSSGGGNISGGGASGSSSGGSSRA